MVNGLKKFRDYFKDYSGSYLLIGGAACDWLMNKAGLDFRATKDLDIILVIEAIDDEFIAKFWDFIKKGNYEIKAKGEGKAIFYRFTKPGEKDFPSQLEFFTRKPDLKGLPEDIELTPIPAEGEISSLSAILMDDGYYEFTLENSLEDNGIHMATTLALICLKARAYLDLKGRKKMGEKIDSKNIKKHKLDILRLALTLTDNDKLEPPEMIKKAMKQYIEDIQEEMPDMKQLLKGMGLPAETISFDQAIGLLQKVYNLDNE
ncbi:MAG: hypothetical protein K9J27_01715 [Bacteroidales bacterium]|nr:hypothetical protein [Bacteroidales bacterium]